MKTKLLVVGKTNDKNITKGIDDYVGRVKHYMPFDIDGNPRTQKHEKPHTEQPEGDGSGTDSQEAATVRHRGAARRTRQGIQKHRVCQMDREAAADCTEPRVHNRRTVRLCRLRIREKRRQAVALKNDFLTPDDTPALRGADIQGVHNHKRRTVSSRMKTIKHECLSPLRLFRRTNTRKC